MKLIYMKSPLIYEMSLCEMRFNPCQMQDPYISPVELGTTGRAQLNSGSPLSNLIDFSVAGVK